MKTMTKKTTDWLVMAAARIEGKAMMAAARTRQVLTLAAAAAVMGLATASCSSEDGLAEEPVQQPAENTDAVKKYTMTVTASKGGDDSALARAMAEAGLTGDATTRALSLSSDGKTLDATWAEGETVTVYNVTKEADLEGTLTAQTSGASTTLTGTLSGTIDEDDELWLFFHVDATLGFAQGGTLQFIADNLDFDRATVTVKSIDVDGNITIYEPAAVFDDKVTSIVRFTLVDKADPTKRLKPTSLSIRTQYKFTGQSSYIPIAYTLTGLTDATYTANAYAEDNGDGVLYASFHGADFNDFHMTATMPDGDTYEYVRPAVEFEVGKFYSITVKMNRLVDLSRYYNFEAQDGDVLMGELPVGYYVEIADGATVTLRDASINGTGGPGITCNGGATIILEGSNTVTGSEGQPGIYVPESFTLTIKGSGSLRAEGGTYEYGGNKWGGAGIGGRPGGGNVIIEGGFITAIGGYGAPGIGGSYDSQYSSFGTITIKNTVTCVTATKGTDAPYCIGPSKDGSCVMITFGDEEVYTSSEWNDVIEDVLEPYGSVIVGGLNVTKTATNVAGDTWTLTPETNN